MSSTNPTIRNNLCVGGSCANDESFSGNFNQLVLKTSNTRILFDDTTVTGGFPFHDWALQANDRLLNENNQFMIRNETLDTTPVTIQAGSGTNALFLASSGNLGLGTSLPGANLHIEDSNTAALRLRRNDSGGTVLRDFELSVSNSGFSVRDVVANTFPFVIQANAPSASFTLGPNILRLNGSQNSDFDFGVSSSNNANAFFVDAGSDNVGIGTDTPAAPLHVSSTGTFTFFRIEATGASPNTAADMTFTSGPAGSGGEYRINVVDGDGPEMRVDGAGYVIATAGFRVGATNLIVPDYVFAPDYQLRPLAEVATFIEQNKHLPDVPSAADVAAEGLDITEMQFALLKKVEELTLYTLEQEATITTLLTRLEALETRAAAD